MPRLRTDRSRGGGMPVVRRTGAACARFPRRPGGSRRGASSSRGDPWTSKHGFTAVARLDRFRRLRRGAVGATAIRAARGRRERMVRPAVGAVGPCRRTVRDARFRLAPLGGHFAGRGGRVLDFGPSPDSGADPVVASCAGLASGVVAFVAAIGFRVGMDRFRTFRLAGGGGVPTLPRGGSAAP